MAFPTTNVSIQESESSEEPQRIKPGQRDFKFEMMTDFHQPTKDLKNRDYAFWYSELKKKQGEMEN